MTRTGRIAVAVAAALVLAGVLFWVITREELASGSGKRGDWKLVASWSPTDGYCTTLYEENGQGGACGYAQPETINESMTHLVMRGDQRYTLVTGPVPSKATSIEVVAENRRDKAEAEIADVLGMGFFVAELPGVHKIWTIVATDQDGEVVTELEVPIPPPYASTTRSSSKHPSPNTLRGCPRLVDPGRGARIQARRVARRWAQRNKDQRVARFQVEVEQATGSPRGGCYRKQIPHRHQTWKRTWIANVRWTYKKGSGMRRSASLASSTLFVGKTRREWRMYFRFH